MPHALQTLYKHQGTELKALRQALEKRDARSEDLQQQLKREREEAHQSNLAFQQQIADLKGRPPACFALQSTHLPGIQILQRSNAQYRLSLPRLHKQSI